MLGLGREIGGSLAQQTPGKALSEVVYAEARMGRDLASLQTVDAMLKRVRRGCAILFLAFAVVGEAQAAKPASHKTWDVPCEKVFVTGTQLHEIAWALRGDGLDNNLYKRTCMQPVSDAKDADAILDIEIDPKLVPNVNRNPDSAGYWVNCSSDARGSFCSDSAGYMLMTNCSARGCSSYYGPNPAIVLTQAVGDALRQWAGSTAAWGYLFSTKDHHLIWKYQGVGQWHMDLTKYSECPKEHKFSQRGPGKQQPCKEPTKLLE